jgi:hypothetical protein
MWTERNLIPMILAMYAEREIFIAFRCRLVVRKVLKFMEILLLLMYRVTGRKNKKSC